MRTARSVSGAHGLCARRERGLLGRWPAEGRHRSSSLNAGHQEDGTSEYSFYTFRGSHENSGKPTFQTWLYSMHGAGKFRVHEYPTVDAGPRSLSEKDIESIRAIVMPLLSLGETVVVFDSYGSERTGQFCKAMGLRRR